MCKLREDVTFWSQLGVSGGRDGRADGEGRLGCRALRPEGCGGVRGWGGRIFRGEVVGRRKGQMCVGG